jgi:5-(carboxyamino)imidazole ribonucleotide synthase
MSMLLPGSTIAVLGGGQLGRMLAFEARRMGYRVGVLDPSRHGPAAQVADFSVCAAFDNAQAALALATRADVVTVETELIPHHLLAQLETHKPVRPGATVLWTIQDRLTQKDFLRQHGFPLPAYAPVHDQASLARAVRLVDFPAILKRRRSGYDGRGQVRVEGPQALAAAWESLGRDETVLEAFIAFEKEISVLLARNTRGDVEVYPIAENVHRRHILHTTRVPAHISAAAAQRAAELAVHIAQALDHCGVMAVEMFLLPDDTVLVNEIAPRTHNSGHYTYGACVTSQFEQHLRAICGLPLGPSTLLSPVVMVNLLGDVWQGGGPYWEHVLCQPYVRLHLYGKIEARPGRKMGHLLLLHASTDESLQLAETLLAQLAAGATARA